MLEDRILFIDGEAIVIDKPAGLPVDQPRRGGDSLVGRLDELKCGFKRPPTPMHRLDQDTSGCLLLARNANARAIFQKAFEAHSVEKYYLAIISRRGRGGGVAPSTCRWPRNRAPKRAGGWSAIRTASRRRRTGAGSRSATDGPWSSSARSPAAPIKSACTRARRSQSGIVGDRVYGTPGGPMLLHASRLVVPRDPKPVIDVTAPLPDYFGDWGDAG